MSDGSYFYFVASNLHSGGAVQVAASLLDEWAQPDLAQQLAESGCQIRGEVSDAVWRNVGPHAREGLDMTVRNRRALSFWNVDDLRAKHEVAFVVFGPIYFPLRARRRVAGYADVTSIYGPHDSGYLSRGWPEVRRRLRGTWSRRWIRDADVVVVETPALRDRLVQTLGVKTPRTIVIPNAVNSMVSASHGPAWRPPAPGTTEIRFAYPTRDYPHKNLEFLPALNAAVAMRSPYRLTFIVTLTEEEWRRRSPEFRACSSNIGPVPVGDIPRVLRMADGVIFPSLLEAYSATPIEALAVGVPLYASDRPFVRSICGDAPVYIDPQSPDRAAEQVVDALQAPDSSLKRIRVGKEMVARMPSARERAVRVLEELTRRSFPR